MCNNKATIKNDFFLALECTIAGLVAGLISVFYRYSLTYAEEGLFFLLKKIRGNALFITFWFLLLALMGFIVMRLLKWEGFAGGSGVPQVMAEARDKLEVTWWRALIIKFVTGTLCFFSGLSLGRTGPSVQLGAMAAKGYARFRKHNRENELFFLSCGAAAGLAATFNAPLAGLFFMLEEIQGKLTKKLVLGGLFSCAAASISSQFFFGVSPVFNYPLHNIPHTRFYLLLPLGILLGLGGSLYNFCLLKTASLFKSIQKIPKEAVYMIIFIIAGIIGLVFPDILAGGKVMAGILEKETLTLQLVLFLLLAKFIYTIFSAGSGVPGGLFFPLLILGAFLGASYGLFIIDCFSLPRDWIAAFIILGIAGLFAGAIRTPLTAIFLAVELCQVPGLFFPLVIVTAISCITANLTESAPICRTLMDQLLAARR